MNGLIYLNGSKNAFEKCPRGSVDVVDALQHHESRSGDDLAHHIECRFEPIGLSGSIAYIGWLCV
jgi:hypothetical protein